MRVTIDIPDPVWWRAAQAADAQGARIADIIHTTVLNLAGEESARQILARARRDRIVELAQEGLPDAVICERTGENRQYVATVRRKAGLRANRQRRSETEKTA